MRREVLENDRGAILREQHQEWLKEGYNGHNRHSGFVSMDTLRERRSRRKWNRNMSAAVDRWNGILEKRSASTPHIHPNF